MKGEIIKMKLENTKIVEDENVKNGTDRAVEAILAFHKDGNENELDLEWLQEEVELFLNNDQNLTKGMYNTRRPAHSVAYDALLTAINVRAEGDISSRQLQAGFKKLGLDFKEILKPCVEYIKEQREENLEESKSTEVSTEDFIADLKANKDNMTRGDLQGAVEARCMQTGEDEEELLKKIDEGKSPINTDYGIDAFARYDSVNNESHCKVPEDISVCNIGDELHINGNDYVKVADNKWEYRSKQANVIGPDRTDDEVQKIVSDIYSQLNESKETLIEEDGESNKEFLTDRDKEIFDKLKNEPEEKTELDYIQDRIGQQITVDDLNRILQDIFRTDNKIYLLASDLYNMDLTSSQELVFFDDTDMYVINYDIIDMDEGIIEITDANVE